MAKFAAVSLTSCGRNGASFVYRSVTFTAVTTFVVTPHIRCAFTQSRRDTLPPCLTLTHVSCRLVEKPEESTAKSVSIADNGRALCVTRALMMGVSSALSRYLKIEL